MPGANEQLLFAGTSLAVWGTRMGRCILPPHTQLPLQLWQELWLILGIMEHKGDRQAMEV